SRQASIAVRDFLRVHFDGNIHRKKSNCELLRCRRWRLLIDVRIRSSHTNIVPPTKTEITSRTRVELLFVSEFYTCRWKDFQAEDHRFGSGQASGSDGRWPQTYVEPVDFFLR